MAELAPHDHDLDGHLHDGCPMCDEIRSRMPLAVREKKLDDFARSLGQRVHDNRLTNYDLGSRRPGPGTRRAMARRAAEAHLPPMTAPPVVTQPSAASADGSAGGAGGVAT